jgi:hypothetical protein
VPSDTSQRRTVRPKKFQNIPRVDRPPLAHFGGLGAKIAYTVRARQVLDKQHLMNLSSGILRPIYSYCVACRKIFWVLLLQSIVLRQILCCRPSTTPLIPPRVAQQRRLTGVRRVKVQNGELKRPWFLQALLILLFAQDHKDYSGLIRASRKGTLRISSRTC